MDVLYTQHHEAKSGYVFPWFLNLKNNPIMPAQALSNAVVELSATPI